jgi:beta-N-acetylhexosaminidase
VAALRAERPDLLVAIDHEGGEFSHLSVVDPSPLPSPRTLGDLDDPDLTRSCARDAAATLAELGIDVMLAPSVDVNSNPANPIISTRAFGSTAEVVSRHGAAFIQGVHDAGIAACAKHFPGHGDVSVDSHLALPRVDRTVADIDAVELAPFRAAISAGVDLVMSAHIVFSAFDAAPATLSHRLLTTLLREELGFEGVVTTDALEMGAITAGSSIPDAVTRSVAAGADLAMVASADANPHALAEELVAAVRDGAVSGDRVQEAAARVRELASRTAARPRAGGLGGAPLREVARRSVAGQRLPPLGQHPYVVDLAQDVHPAWHPYFDGLPTVLGRDGVVIRGDDPRAVAEAARAADGRPLVVAVQDAVRTPWMVTAMERLVRDRDGDALVLCTGLPEDQQLVPVGVPSAVTSGRNVIVLQEFSHALTREKA